MGKSIFARRMLSMAMVTAIALSPLQAAAASNDLEGHWAEKVISEWKDRGLVSGYRDGSFQPNQSITRAEFVTMLNHALDMDEAGHISFTDVQDGDWFYQAVATAVGAGYCKGYDGNLFKPKASITRAEAAVMMANVVDLDADAAGSEKFTDAAAIPAWAKSSIDAVAEAGFMSGYPDGSFGAQKSITRAEAVSSLNRLMQAMEETTAPAEEKQDVIVTEEDTVIKNQVITGDLVIDEAVGEGEVYIEDTTIAGDIIVNGGGSNSVYLDNVVVKGTVSVNKKEVHIHISGETQLSHILLHEISNLTAADFAGEVEKITIVGDVGTDAKIVIDIPVNLLVIAGEAEVVVQSDVETVEITEDAEGAKIEVAQDAKVNTIIADTEATIAGEGSVGKLEAKADGIVVNEKLNVDSTETADGVSKPITGTSTESTTGSSNSGGGSGSSGGGSSNSGGGSNSSKKYVTAAFAATTVTTEVGKDADATVHLTGATVAVQTAIPANENASITGPETAFLNVNQAGTGYTLDLYTPTKAGTYTYTFTIPAANLTVASGYTLSGDLTVTLTVIV